MKKYPKLKFIIDSNKEIEIYLSFLRDSKHRNINREMRWAFYKPHPKLQILKNENLSKKEKGEILQNYVNHFYKKHLTEIKNNVFFIKKEWEKYEKNFLF